VQVLPIKTLIGIFLPIKKPPLLFFNKGDKTFFQKHFSSIPLANTTRV